MNGDFFSWYQNAILPTRCFSDGVWTDVATGNRYVAPTDPSMRLVSCSRIQDAQLIVKLFDGPGLIGSSKQVAWAEKIRTEHIESMDQMEALALLLHGQLLRKASFWIDNRGRQFNLDDVLEHLHRLESLREDLHLFESPELRKCVREDIVIAIRHSTVFLRIDFGPFDPYRLV